MMRWTVGCEAERWERVLWRARLEDTWFTDVDCIRLPDGTPIAVCASGGDDWFQMWDLVAGTPLGGPSHDAPAGRGYPCRVICTDLPDGTPVAVTLGFDGALRVWDLVGRRMRAATDGSAVGPWDAIASTHLPDGTAIVVTGGQGGAIRFWDVETARPYGSPIVCERPSPGVACPDGSSLLIIADGPTLKVWDLAAGRFRGAPIETGFRLVSSVECLRLADGTVLAVVGSDRERDAEHQRYGQVRAWDVTTGRPCGPPLTEHGGEIRALAAVELSDGTPIAISVDRVGSTSPLNLRSGRAHGPSLSHRGDDPAVACVRLPGGAPVVVVADVDVWVWSLDVRPSPQGFVGPVRVLGRARLPDGDEVLVTAGDEARDGDTVQLWEARTGRPRGRMLAGAAASASGCLQMGDGAAVVTVPTGRSGVRLRDLETGAVRDVALEGHGRPASVVTCLDLHDGTPVLVTGGDSVQAWRADTGRPYGPPLPLRIGWSRGLSCLQLPDGTLVVAPNDHSMRAWDAGTGRPYGASGGHWTAIWSGAWGVTSCVVAADGTVVAVNAAPDFEHRHGIVRAGDLTTGRPCGGYVDLRTPRPDVIACTRLPDGSVIAAVGGSRNEDHLVEIVDPIGGRKRDEIAVPSPVMDLGFTGEHLLVVRTYLDVAVYDVA
jgi:WD40 repeat protein